MAGDQSSIPCQGSNMPYIPQPTFVTDTREFPIASQPHLGPNPTSTSRPHDTSLAVNEKKPVGEEKDQCASTSARLSFSRQRGPDPINMTLTGDTTTDRRKEAGGPWYSPRSRTSSDRTSGTDTTPTRTRDLGLTSSAPTSPGRPKQSSPPRFSLFSSVSALAGFASPAAAVPPDEELLTIDVEAALFPAGIPVEGETFSPAAFKNLQINASGIIRKFQAAYQSRSAAFDQLKVERKADGDEKLELETRSRYLKRQLDEMSQKASETESIIHELMGELSKEKRLRLEERQARDKSSRCSNLSATSEDLLAEEDQQRRARRRSGATAKSDLSSDTDEDSIEASSVFSRSRSPTLTVSTLDSHVPDSIPPAPAKSMPSISTMPRAMRPSQPHISTIQKLFKGMAGDAPRDDDGRGVSSCRNCRGQNASVAWDTASLLRDENRGLKQRVGELEEAVEEALDAVNGIRL